MPTFDEELRDRIQGAAPRAPANDDLFNGLAVRKRRRAVVRKVGTIATVMIVLIGTIVAFAMLDRDTQPAPFVRPTPTSSAPDPRELVLPPSACRASSLEITTSLGRGTAAVYTDGHGPDCPPEGGGTTLVSVDVDGDGSLDATSRTLRDCDILCEIFAVPDVNGDGVSEVAVSTVIADGYDVHLYAVGTTPPSIAPVQVGEEPLTFAWRDVAAQSSGAGCSVTEEGTPTFVVDRVDKNGNRAIVHQETFMVEGTIATSLSTLRDTMKLHLAPRPGSNLCGAPVAPSIALPVKVPATTSNLCDESTIRADIDGDGTPDTAFVGGTGRRNTCPSAVDQEAVVGVDTTGDGVADGRIAPLPQCLACRVVAAIDFNTDGASELVILLQWSSTPYYGIYEWTPAGRRHAGLYPAMIGAGSEQFPEGSELEFSAGGDEGFTGAVECENYPSRPVLVVWASNAPVDGGVNAMRDVVMTKLTMSPGGSFSAIDALHQRLPVTDPQPFDLQAKGCGVDWLNGVT